MKMNHLVLAHTVIILGWTVGLHAGVPMGFPGSMLKTGQWHVGVEFAQGDADWRADGRCTETVIGVGSESYQQDFRIDDLRTHAIFGQLAYGLADDWDIFVRLGGVQTEADIEVPGVAFGTRNAGQTRLDGDYGFAAGLGTRATFYRHEAFSVGGLLQGTWLDPGDSRSTYGYSGSSETLVTNARLRYFQGQLSLAGLYQQENWHLWVGPFVQYTTGDLDLEARYYLDNVAAGSITCTGDLDDSTRLGIHLGGGLRIERFTCWLEGQFTDQSWLWAVGGVPTLE